MRYNMLKVKTENTILIIFTCANCQGTYRSDRSQEDTIAELEIEFPNHKDEEREVVCSHCYEKIMTHMRGSRLPN
jgi:DNA-directed RNA polymerase subunit RPC12/RpoP